MTIKLNRKTIFIAFIILAVLILVGLFTNLSAPTTTKPPPTIVNTPAPASPQISPPPLAQEKIISPDGEAGFQISYLPDTQEYLILITNTPFEKFRQQAEAAFIEKLGITQPEACKLKVTITTPLFANPQEAGKDFLLSFCK